MSDNLKIEALEAEVERYQQREAHFAKALRVTDGGQYRADWDSAISKVLADLAAARAERDGLANVLGEIVKHYDSATGDIYYRPLDYAIEDARTALAAIPTTPEPEGTE